MRTMCAIFFLIFTFLYLYEYQADMLSVVQHVLSHGATHYNRTVGAVIITLLLWMVQLAIYALTKLTRRGHALTYFPSLLLLGILTDVSPDIYYCHYIGNWLWIFPLLMVVYAFVVWAVRQLEPMELPALSIGVFSRMTWINILQMVAMALITCGIGNSSQVFHYRLRVENCIMSEDYAGAAKVGALDARTDSSLTMLRVWALSEQGKLGDNLFEYSLKGNSDAMLPNGSSVRLMMAPESKLYKELGVVFREKMRPVKYFEKLHRGHFATRKAHDWLLCAYLLDCNLEAFASALPKYYKLDEALPQSYREAIVLYNHMRNNSRIVYRSPVLDADYEDFISLARKIKNPQERLATLKDNYGKTYWYYFMSQRLQSSQSS